jgi:hypothetical protein
MSGGKIVTAFSAPLFIGSDQRSRLITMGRNQLQAELSIQNVNWGNVLSRVEQRTAALDDYVASIRREAHLQSTLRKRVGLLAIMGFAPFLTAVVATVLLMSGTISSENGQTLAGFVVAGCILVTVLALIAITHVALQSAFHANLLERSAEERSMRFVNATLELLGSDALIGAQVIEHFRYCGLGDYFQNIKVEYER